jgi:hypothetical protein
MFPFLDLETTIIEAQEDEKTVNWCLRRDLFSFLFIELFFSLRSTENNSHSILNFNVFSCRFIWIEYQNADTIAWILISHVEKTFSVVCFSLLFFYTLLRCFVVLSCIIQFKEEKKHYCCPACFYLTFFLPFNARTWANERRFLGWSFVRAFQIRCLKINGHKLVSFLKLCVRW